MFPGWNYTFTASRVSDLYEFLLITTTEISAFDDCKLFFFFFCSDRSCSQVKSISHFVFTDLKTSDYLHLSHINISAFTGRSGFTSTLPIRATHECRREKHLARCLCFIWRRGALQRGNHCDWLLCEQDVYPSISWPHASLLEDGKTRLYIYNIRRLCEVFSV